MLGIFLPSGKKKRKKPDCLGSNDQNIKSSICICVYDSSTFFLQMHAMNFELMIQTKQHQSFDEPMIPTQPHLFWCTVSVHRWFLNDKNTSQLTGCRTTNIVFIRLLKGLFTQIFPFSYVSFQLFAARCFTSCIYFFCCRMSLLQVKNNICWDKMESADV